MAFDPSLQGYQIILNSIPTSNFEKLATTINEVEIAANKERDVILELTEISNRCSTLEIRIVKDSSKFHIVNSFDRNKSIIEADIVAVSILRSKNGLEKFSGLFQELEAKLETSRITLTNWEAVQNTMLSVCKFFLSGEVRLQLASELRRYHRIEAAYKSIISTAQKHKKLSIMIDLAPDLSNSLMEMLQSLQIVIKNLQGWLDNKRLIFPRLCFVSDEELLDIIASNDPNQLQLYFSRY